MKIFKKRSSGSQEKAKETVAVPDAAKNFRTGYESAKPEFREKFQTTCAQCGSPCEVPFRPVEGRKLYCNTCFRDIRNRSMDNRHKEREHDRFPQRDFGGHKSFNKPEFAGNDKGNSNETNRQLQMLNSKMDRLVRAIEIMANINQVLPVAVEAKKESAAMPALVAKAKKPAKKTPKNKGK